MKRILLIIFYFIISSCENNDNKSFLSETQGNPEISMADFKATTKYPNIYIQNGLKFKQKDLDKFHKSLEDITRFLKTYFPDFIPILNEGSEDVNAIKIYFVDSSKDAQKKHPNKIFFETFHLEFLEYERLHYQIFNTLISALHWNNKMFLCDDLNNLGALLHRMFEVSRYCPSNSKQKLSKTRPFEVNYLNPPEEYTESRGRVNDSILEVLFKSKIDNNESLGNIKDFSDNIFHLMNLIEIARISFYNLEEKEIRDKCIQNIDKFIENPKSGEQVRPEELKLTSDKPINEEKIFAHYLLNAFFNKFSFRGKVFFVYQDIKNINFEWVTEYAEQELKLNPKLNQNFIILNEEDENHLDPKLDNVLLIRIPKDISAIDSREEYIKAINKLNFIEGLALESKNNDFKDAFRKYYSKISEFSEKDLQAMDFTALLESYKLFISVLYSPFSHSNSINSLDELIDYQNSEKGVDLIKVPREEELRFFLQNVKREELDPFNPRHTEIYMENYLHFRHLLATTRIAKGYKSLEPKMFNFLKREFGKFLDYPLQPISDTYFKNSMSLFFNPFDLFYKKLKPFWDFKYDISAYLLDYYRIRKQGGSGIWSRYSDANLQIPLNSNGRKPLLNLNFESFQTVDILLSITLNHEIGHHLQQSGNFMEAFTKVDATVNYMGSELEADMYAGFYAHHSDGLNLDKNKIMEMSSVIKEHYGDGTSDFRSMYNPHGQGYQRKRAYLLGANLAKLPKYKSISSDTKNKLHDEFKHLYLHTDYLRDISLLPGVESLFSDSFNLESFEETPKQVQNNDYTLYDFKSSSYENIFISKHLSPDESNLSRQINEAITTIGRLREFMDSYFLDFASDLKRKIYLSVGNSSTVNKLQKITTGIIVLTKAQITGGGSSYIDEVIEGMLYDKKTVSYFEGSELKKNQISVIRLLFELSRNNTKFLEEKSLPKPLDHEIYQLSSDGVLLNQNMIIEIFKVIIRCKQSLGPMKSFWEDIEKLILFVKLSKLNFISGNKERGEEYLNYLKLYIKKLKQQEFDQPIDEDLVSKFSTRLKNKSVKELRSRNFVEHEIYDFYNEFRTLLGSQDKIEDKNNKLWSHFKLLSYRGKYIFIHKSITKINLDKMIEKLENKLKNNNKINKDFIVINQKNSSSPNPNLSNVFYYEIDNQFESKSSNWLDKLKSKW